MADDEMPHAPPELPPEYSQEWPVPWQPVWGEREGLGARLETALARGATGLLARCPEFLLAPLIGGLARFARRVDRRHAQAAREYIDTALGPLSSEETERRVLQAYRHFLRMTVECAGLNRLSVAEMRAHFELDIPARVRAHVEAGGGCVLASAHVGNWEAAVAAAPMSGFDPFYGVAKPAKNKPLSQAVQRDRERRGVRLLPRRGAMKSAPTILRAGGHLGLLLDQRARVKPALVPFFGRLARCDRSAAVLLRRLAAPVVFVRCLRIGRMRFRFDVPEVFWPEDLAGVAPDAITTRVNEALERLILSAPDQYFWLHDRYKDTPASLDAQGETAG